MRKYICLAVFALSLGHVAAHSHIVPDENLRVGAVSYCPPTNLRYQDVSLAIGATKEVIDSLPKYYISYLIGIKENEEPPYEAIENPSRYKGKLMDFSIKMGQLVDGNDVCDKSAIEYVARFYNYFCPNSDKYASLSNDSQKMVKFFSEFPGEVFQKAKAVSGCTATDKR